MAKDSMATALRKKMSAPLTKALRYIPKKHEDYKMDKSNKEYAFLKDYNAREQSGGAVQNSDKDRAIFKMIKDRK
jgi:hypothetical protein